jgi:hypothetical protein
MILDNRPSASHFDRRTVKQLKLKNNHEFVRAIWGGDPSADAELILTIYFQESVFFDCSSKMPSPFSPTRQVRLAPSVTSADLLCDPLTILSSEKRTDVIFITFIKTGNSLIEFQ